MWLGSPQNYFRIAPYIYYAYMLRLYSYYTICEEKYEIAAVIINVWGYTEILPQNLQK